MRQLEILDRIRESSGTAQTTGLDLDVIEKFLKIDPNLIEAINQAELAFSELQKKFPSIIKKDEAEQIKEVQAGFVNFYTEDTVNPYVSLTASGPWIVTTCGAVLHDSGGYGMLGLGHAPKNVLTTLEKPHVMANIMTANFTQLAFIETLNNEIGYRRSGDKRHPYGKYLCLNSGSEAVTVAARISDINAKTMTAPGGLHADKKVKFLALKGGFHGRTDRPAQVSDSSLPKYRASLASFNHRENLVTIEANNPGELKNAFAQAETEGVFFEAFFMEPVMGEGNPGQAITTEFYSLARELTAKNKTLLIVDSIQAAIRAHGCLSICDYPGFENLDPPDLETYSKAVNAGQFPLSVLALRDPIAKLYQKGVYGNTMTSNPKSLEVAIEVLSGITPEFRKNISDRGVEFVDKLKKLQEEFPEDITGVKGTGLLLAASINPSRHKVVGFDCLEEKMRKKGIGVIHGGTNALRFTPHFRITSDEIDLVVDVLRGLLKK